MENENGFYGSTAHTTYDSKYWVDRKVGKMKHCHGLRDLRFRKIVGC